MCPFDYMFTHEPTPAERGVDYEWETPEEFIEFANLPEDEQWKWCEIHNVEVL